ncbi:MAG: phosphate ABC transporter substrate-binding/OmpA family protein [Verrucomicrobiales bacterium]|nr:phosphate ABC transporter substrate-binding/OmpA family protein [Verrucomicrobiales bacterium]
MRKFFVFVCILLLLAMIGWKLSEPLREKLAQENQLKRTSDAAKIEHYLTVGGDEWLGYLIFRSPKFRQALEEEGIALTFEVEADFQARFNKLATGEFDFVCATIDSFLVNARSSNFPAVIVFGIDESYGGDAVLARSGIESLDDLNREEIQGALVGYSPSEFLLKSQIAHFGLDQLKPKMGEFRTDDAQSAYDRLAKGEVDFAVLWEPLVSKALREIPEVKRLMDTRQARGIVYDVAIASRSLVAEQPKVVQTVTRLYFESLNEYLASPGEFTKLAQSDSGESRPDAEAMLSGVRFLNLQDNREMMSGTRDLRFTDAVSNITRILVDVGDLPSDPLNGNPRLVINSGFIEQVGGGQAVATGGREVQPMKRFFRPLSGAQWQSLYEMKSGTLLEEPITFGVGQSEIEAEFQTSLKEASQKLVHYPGHRIIVQAHVSPGSDPQLDRELSQERADAIRDFMVAQGAVDKNRIFAVGMGGDEPVVRKDGEGIRSWKRRCRRARIYLAEDT